MNKITSKETINHNGAQTMNKIKSKQTISHNNTQTMNKITSTKAINHNNRTKKQIKKQSITTTHKQ